MACDKRPPTQATPPVARSRAGSCCTQLITREAGRGGGRHSRPSPARVKKRWTSSNRRRSRLRNRRGRGRPRPSSLGPLRSSLAVSPAAGLPAGGTPLPTAPSGLDPQRHGPLLPVPSRLPRALGEAQASSWQGKARLLGGTWPVLTTLLGPGQRPARPAPGCRRLRHPGPACLLTCRASGQGADRPASPADWGPRSRLLPSPRPQEAP